MCSATSLQYSRCRTDLYLLVVSATRVNTVNSLIILMGLILCVGEGVCNLIWQDPVLWIQIHCIWNRILNFEINFEKKFWCWIVWWKLYKKKVSCTTIYDYLYLLKKIFCKNYIVQFIKGFLGSPCAIYPLTGPKGGVLKVSRKLYTVT